MGKRLAILTIAVQSAHQVPFAESSVCDRIAFAPASRRNPTEFLLCREKASKVAQLCLTGRFLWFGLGMKIAELWSFSGSSSQRVGNFSAVQTAWRRERDSNPRYGFGTVSLEVLVSCS